jgi:hypothetical protein
MNFAETRIEEGSEPLRKERNEESVALLAVEGKPMSGTESSEETTVWGATGER